MRANMADQARLRFFLESRAKLGAVLGLALLMAATLSCADHRKEAADKRRSELRERREAQVALAASQSPGSVISVAFSPDGKILASASADDTLRLWDVTSHQSLGEPLKGPSSFVWSVAF